MSSSSSTPISLFEYLTINPQMTSTNVNIRSRALEVRDILSSFDRDVFPLEFKPQIFAQLDRSYQTRPPVAQWTIQEDLAATLLQWGTYHEPAFDLLKFLQSDTTRARCFYEKVGRRFTKLFEDYDTIVETRSSIRLEVQRIADGFRNIVAAVKEDRAYRQQYQDSIAKALLDALVGICQRHMDLGPTSETPTTPRRGTRRATGSPESHSNLYDALIKNPSGEQAVSLFMLDVLETFPGSTYVNLESEHSNLVSLLEINNAPPAYKYRVGRLPSGTDPTLAPSSVTQAQQGTSSVRVTPIPTSEARTSASTTVQGQPSTETQTQTEGSSTGPSQTRPKRAAEDTSTASRKGKKKTSR